MKKYRKGERNLRNQSQGVRYQELSFKLPFLLIILTQPARFSEIMQQHST